MSIDLKQLSARLGLSPTTVSRALNGYSDVSAATRERVEQMARDLGYQPNLAARRLARGQADAVGIVYKVGADFLGNPSFLQTLAGLSDTLEQAEIDVLLAAAHPHGEMRVYERMVRGRRVDALIVAHTQVHDERIEYLLTTKMPFIAYGRTRDAHRYPWVDFDNEAESRLAVQRLVAAGHRRIAYVHQPLHWNFAQGRYDGYVSAMAAAGLAVEPALIFTGGQGRREGHAAGTAFLALPERPAAVLVDGNLNGIGFVRALLDAGVVLGRDLSLIINEGVPEDSPLQALGIDSVQQPTPYDSGRILANMLLHLVRGVPLEQPHVLCQPVYVPGRTVAPPPA